jgi:hypothetical protein
MVEGGRKFSDGRGGDVFESNADDEFVVMLLQVDPRSVHNLVFSQRVREQKLVADSGDGVPFAGADFGHVFARARVDKLDHDHRSGESYSGVRPSCGDHASRVVPTRAAKRGSHEPRSFGVHVQAANLTAISKGAE